MYIFMSLLTGASSALLESLNKFDATFCIQCGIYHFILIEHQKKRLTCKNTDAVILREDHQLAQLYLENVR